MFQKYKPGRRDRVSVKFSNGHLRRKWILGCNYDTGTLEIWIEWILVITLVRMKFCFGRKLIKIDSPSSFPERERDPERRFNYYSSPFATLSSTDSYISVKLNSLSILLWWIKLRRKCIESIIFLHDHQINRRIARFFSRLMNRIEEFEFYEELVD